MPAYASNAFDGSVTGESFNGGSRERFDGANKIFSDGRDGEGGTRVNDDGDAIWGPGVRLEGVATMWKDIAGSVVETVM